MSKHVQYHINAKKDLHITHLYFEVVDSNQNVIAEFETAREANQLLNELQLIQLAESKL